MLARIKRIIRVVLQNIGFVEDVGISCRKISHRKIVHVRIQKTGDRTEELRTASPIRGGTGSVPSHDDLSEAGRIAEKLT